VSRQISAAVAAAFLAGPWDPTAMRVRLHRSLGIQPQRWTHRLVQQVLPLYPRPPLDRPRELAAVIRALPAWDPMRLPSRVAHWYLVPTDMGPMPWPVRQLATVGALARLLDVDAGELAWFADVRNLERSVSEPLRHYRWRQLPKRDGVRLIAAPKPRLKEIQRRILRHLLTAIPVHEAAHGAVPGRSVRTALLPHARSAVVIRADLRSFFASVPAHRVYALLRRAGYPEPVAHLVTGLCTTVPPAGLQTGPVRPQLPPGAPTSPALANLVCFALDRRLTGLAAAFGARYTRYVDDLTFSGGPRLGSSSRSFLDRVSQVVQAEGHRLVPAKSIVLNSSGRQQALDAVLNERPTISRQDRDNLRALLHNCAVNGWRTQSRGRPNFPAYVRGRIAHVAGLDPVAGNRLLLRYEAVDWS
jgi:RNA-directed DNA polymerase